MFFLIKVAMRVSAFAVSHGGILVLPDIIFYFSFKRIDFLSILFHEGTVAPILHSVSASGVVITRSTGCSSQCVAGTELDSQSVLPAQCLQHLLRKRKTWHLAACWDS